MLSLEGVSKRYGEHWALKPSDLVFDVGTTTALVGESGCGKSSLLKLCNGLIKPTSGTVSAFGSPLDYNDLPSLRRKIGYAVQGNGLFPHLSARDNICLGASLAGWSRDEIATRLDELLQLVRLDSKLLDRFPHELSGGQQQRVGLGRAMMLRPEVLLLDEPFAAIDPITRFEIHEQLLHALEQEPATVVLVTHDMREALKLATTVVLIHAGLVRTPIAVNDLRSQFPNDEPEQIMRHLLATAIDAR